jgi:hypothetical protein
MPFMMPLTRSGCLPSAALKFFICFSEVFGMLAGQLRIDSKLTVAVGAMAGTTHGGGDRLATAGIAFRRGLGRIGRLYAKRGQCMQTKASRERGMGNNSSEMPGFGIWKPDILSQLDRILHVGQ